MSGLGSVGGLIAGGAAGIAGIAGAIHLMDKTKRPTGRLGRDKRFDAQTPGQTPPLQPGQPTDIQDPSRTLDPDGKKKPVNKRFPGKQLIVGGLVNNVGGFPKEDDKDKDKQSGGSGGTAEGATPVSRGTGRGGAGSNNPGSSGIPNSSPSSSNAVSTPNKGVTPSTPTASNPNTTNSSQERLPDSVVPSGIVGTANAAKVGPEWGNPRDPNFQKDYLTTIKNPQTGQSITVHKNSAEQFQRQLNDMHAQGYDLKSVAGYNLRGNTSNRNMLSQHAFGNAIDVNPGKNPYQSASGPMKTDMPAGTSGQAARNGLSWGGDWRSIKDPMHFEGTGRKPWQEKQYQDQVIKGQAPQQVGPKEGAWPGQTGDGSWPKSTPSTSVNNGTNPARDLNTKEGRMQGSFDAYRKAGFSDSGARALAAEVGRENDYRPDLMFGSHMDPYNNQKNIGMLSHQKDRATNMASFLQKEGALNPDGSMPRTQANLDAQARFHADEMKRQNPDLHKYLTGDQPADRNVAGQRLGDEYIRWRQNDPRYASHKNKRDGYYNQLGNTKYENGTAQPEKGHPLLGKGPIGEDGKPWGNRSAVDYTPSSMSKMAASAQVQMPDGSWKSGDEFSEASRESNRGKYGTQPIVEPNDDVSNKNDPTGNFYPGGVTPEGNNLSSDVTKATIDAQEPIQQPQAPPPQAPTDNNPSSKSSVGLYDGANDMSPMLAMMNSTMFA